MRGMKERKKRRLGMEGENTIGDEGEGGRE